MTVPQTELWHWGRAHRAGGFRAPILTLTLHSDLELQDDCAYGTKQRPWSSSRKGLAHTLHICVDFRLLLAQCKARLAPATAAWQIIPSIFSPLLCSAQILYGMMLRDPSTPFVLSREGFGHLKTISLCNLRLPSVQAPVLFTSPAVEAALPGLCA